MNKTKRNTAQTTSSTPSVVDCEVCRNYCGSYFLSRFQCSKGHTQEKTWTLKRDAGCKDFSQMTRDERILKQFEHDARFNGDKNIKTYRSEVRRMVTGIDKTLTRFGAMMTADQIDAMREAATHLKALGNDLEHAGERAVRLQKQSQAERDAKEKARRAAQAVEVFGDMPDAEVIAICEDLLAYDGNEGTEWIKSSKGQDAFIEFSCPYAMRQALDNCRRQQTAGAMASLKEEGAEAIKNLKDPGYYRRYARWTDFEAFRAWRRQVTATIAAIAKGADK